MCFENFRKTSYVASFVLIIIATFSMVTIYHSSNKLSKGWLLHNLTGMVFFQMFGAVFTITYATLVIRASMKYGKTKELFNMPIAKLILLSLVLLYPLGLNVQILHQKQKYISKI